VWIVVAALCLWVLAANVSPDFTPVRSELATAHGFSRGILNLVVLTSSESFTHAPVWSLLACAALFLVLAGLPKPYLVTDFGATGVGIARLLPAGGAVALLLAVAISPYVTPYRAVLAPRTFALSLAIVCATRAYGAVRLLFARWTPIATGIVGAAFFASAMLQALAAYSGNYSGFLHVSREVAARAPFLQERPELARSLIVYDAGYDGQFMYLMAFDPFLRRFSDRPQTYRAVVDNPPYRYGRIGFSLLTDLVSGGQPDWYPAGMVWLIVAAHVALAALLAVAARRHGRSPLAALLYLAIPGFMSSLMSALPEALAAAGMVAGFLWWDERRPLPTALAVMSFAAALLVRETGVILILAIVLDAGRRELGRSVLLLAGSLIPVCIWRLFVASRLFVDFGWRAIAANPGDFGVPFAGLVHLWQAGLSRTQPSAEVAGALLFPIILAAAFVLAVLLLVVRRGPLEIAAAAYGAIAVSLNYTQIWTHLPSGERGTFELFVCLLLLWLESRARPAWIRGALTAFFLVMLGYTFLIAPDAGTSRAALLLVR
jgi:hypothetical protein